MPKPAWLLLFRLSTLFALGVSAALLVDYTGDSATFCAEGSGCATVRASGYGYVPGTSIAVPWVGLVGFASLLVLSLIRTPWAKRLLVAGSVLGGLIALALLWLQWRHIGRFCSLCVLVDGASVLAAVSAFFAFGWSASGDRNKSAAPQATRASTNPAAEPTTTAEPSALFSSLSVPEFRAAAWGLWAVLAVAFPLLWPKVQPRPPVPRAVSAHYKAGKINVIEFADFECPHCRKLHGRLKSIIKDYGDAVHFVRLNMPLRSHPNADHAARVSVCAEGQGKGDAMADALFSAESLSVNGTRALATRLGLDMAAFDQCVEASATRERVAKEAQILKDAGFRGLPTTYVGDQEIIGAQSEETFRDAFEQAKAGSEQTGVPAPLFVGVGVVAALAVGRFGRQPREPEGPARPGRSGRAPKGAAGGERSLKRRRKR